MAICARRKRYFQVMENKCKLNGGQFNHFGERRFFFFYLRMSSKPHANSKLLSVTWTLFVQHSAHGAHHSKTYFHAVQRLILPCIVFYANPFDSVNPMIFMIYHKKRRQWFKKNYMGYDSKCFLFCFFFALKIISF